MPTTPLPGMGAISIAVNVSARQLALPTFVEEVRELLACYAIAPKHLKLEITESALMERPDEAIEILRADIVRTVDDGRAVVANSSWRDLPMQPTDDTAPAAAAATAKAGA